MDAANGMPPYEHINICVNADDTKPPPEGSKGISNSLSEVAIENDGIESEDKDYEYLILKPDHFKMGTLSKGKDMLQNEDPDFKLRENVVNIINNGYKHNLNWSLEEHNIKIEILHDIQETTPFHMDPYEKQLEFYGKIA